MKKFKKCIIAALIAALSLTVISGGIINASAKEKETVVVKDDFSNVKNAGTVDENYWAKFGDDNSTVGQTNDGKSTLKFLKKKSNGEMVAALSREKYAMKSLQFDFFMEKGFTSWMGVNLLESNEYAAGGVPSVYGSPLLFTMRDMSVNGVQLSDTSKNKYAILLGEEFDLGSGKGTDYTGEWLTVKYVFNAEKPYEFDVYFNRRGATELVKAFTATAIKTIDNPDYDANDPQSPKKITVPDTNKKYNDCYIRLGVHDSANGSVEFDNITIEKSDGTTVKEDFEGGGKGVFEIINRGGSADVRAYINSADSLGFANSPKGARVMAKTGVAVDESILESFTNLTVAFKAEIADESSAAFIFGLSRRSDEPFVQNAYAFVMNKEKGKLVKYGENDEEGVLVEEAFAFSQGAIVSAVFDKNGEITISENGEVKITYKTESPVYGGYLGFAACANGTNAKISRVEILNSIYFVPETKSLTHNFSTDYLGNEESPDFYMYSVPENAMSVKNGKLNFNGCSDNSVFAPAYSYDDFILDYKITDIFVGTEDMENHQCTKPGRWIGLDIGRAAYDMRSYGSYLNFYMTITPSGNTSALNVYSKTAVPEKLEITKVKDIPASLFTAVEYDGKTKDATAIKATDAVCVRWVAKNNTLSLYLRRAGDKEFTLYYTVTGVETSGYVALCCTGYTFLNIDDFSIANTSDIYVCGDNDYPETIIKEVEPPYDYNKYLVDTDLEEELNYLDKAQSKGCKGSTSGMLFAALVGVGAALVLKKKR